eukprot:396739-Hanusia_phi.AAC.2
MLAEQLFSELWGSMDSIPAFLYGRTSSGGKLRLILAQSMSASKIAAVLLSSAAVADMCHLTEDSECDDTLFEMMLMLELIPTGSRFKDIVPVLLDDGVTAEVKKLPQVVCRSLVRAVMEVLDEMQRTASKDLESRTVRGVVEEILGYADNRPHGQIRNPRETGPDVDPLVDCLRARLKADVHTETTEATGEVGTAAGDEQVDQGPKQDFHVYLNRDSTLLGAVDVSSFADQFSTWTPCFASLKEFKHKNLKAFLERTSSMQVVGFNEYPYSKGRSLQGQERLIERQYWLKLQSAEREGNCYAILHARYAGKWGSNDRSTILQVNVQHTEDVETSARQRRCHALTQWKESYAHKLPGLPQEGWRWKSDVSTSPLVHQILKKAEEDADLVASFDVEDPCPVSGTKRKALIIANSNYLHAKLVHLPNTCYDGHILETALEELGWAVELKLDLDWEEMMKAIAAFKKDVNQEGGACLFAFVGHAVELSSQLFLIPTKPRMTSLDCSEADSELQLALLKGACIPFSSVQEGVSKARKNNKDFSIFVLDCCRSSCVKRGLAKLSTPSADGVNVYVIYSTSSGQEASDGDKGRGGPFMTAFAKEMLASPKQELDVVASKTRGQLLSSTGRCQLSHSHNTRVDEFFF